MARHGDGREGDGSSGDAAQGVRVLPSTPARAALGELQALPLEPQGGLRLRPHGTQLGWVFFTSNTKVEILLKHLADLKTMLSPKLTRTRIRIAAMVKQNTANQKQNGFG